MGSIISKVKLKIKCPQCGELIFGHSTFYDYYQEEHTTRCEKCGFNETYEMTQIRINEGTKS